MLFDDCVDFLQLFIMKWLRWALRSQSNNSKSLKRSHWILKWVYFSFVQNGKNHNDLNMYVNTHLRLRSKLDCSASACLRHICWWTRHCQVQWFIGVLRRTLKKGKIVRCGEIQVVHANKELENNYFSAFIKNHRKYSSITSKTTVDEWKLTVPSVLSLVRVAFSVECSMSSSTVGGEKLSNSSVLDVDSFKISLESIFQATLHFLESRYSKIGLNIVNNIYLLQINCVKLVMKSMRTFSRLVLALMMRTELKTRQFVYLRSISPVWKDWGEESRIKRGKSFSTWRHTS